jgi:hypothetical protein
VGAWLLVGILFLLPYADGRHYFASSAWSRRVARVTAQTPIENRPEEYSLVRPQRKFNLSRRHTSRSRRRRCVWPLDPVGIKFLRDKRTNHPHQLLALGRPSVFAEKCINLDVNGFAARRRVRDMPHERLSALNVPRKKPLVPVRSPAQETTGPRSNWRKSISMPPRFQLPSFPQAHRNSPRYARNAQALSSD